MLIAAHRPEFYRVMQSQLISRLNSSVSTYKVLLNCHGSTANIAMNNNYYRLISDPSHAITRDKDALVTLLCLLVAGIFTRCRGALYKPSVSTYIRSPKSPSIVSPRIPVPFFLFIEKSFHVDYSTWSVSWVRIPPEQRFFSFRRKKSCLG